MGLSWFNVWGKCNWHTKTIYEHADEAVKGITSLHLLADVSIEPDDIKASTRIKDTLQIDMIKRFFDEHFFKMATDEKPFFTQFYGEGAWGHQKLAAEFQGTYTIFCSI